MRGKIAARFAAASLLALVAVGCAAGEWTRGERTLIGSGEMVMRVLTVDDPEDSLFLRGECADIPTEALSGDMYRRLAEKMVATVTDPSQDGVGIAGPQVGIARRIVAVQRFDREDEPFVVYPNIRITALKGEPVAGMEGCLSVPGRRGKVLRYPEIEIRYSLAAEGDMPARDTTEIVSGFTAVIFQHEADHLDGTLYTDRIAESD